MDFEGALGAFDRAALGLASWDEALSRFTTMSGGHVGQIIGLNRRKQLTINLLTGCSREQAEEYVASGGADPRINPRTRAVLQAKPLQTIAESDFGSHDTLRQHPYYKSFFDKNEVPYCALTKLIDTPEHNLVMAVMRSERQGHLTDRERAFIDAAAPRIRDAVQLGLTLEGQKLELMRHMLDHLAMAAFGLAPDGRIVSLSPTADQLLSVQGYLSVRDGMLMPAAPERRAAFLDAVSATRRDNAALLRRARKMLLPCMLGGRTVKIEIAPLPASSESWLQMACCLVIVHNLPAAPDDLPAYLAMRYRLTPSECAIVERLLKGETAAGIAAARGVAEGTVRNQIKAILAKTGFDRQLDLVLELRR